MSQEHDPEWKPDSELTPADRRMAAALAIPHSIKGRLRKRLVMYLDTEGAKPQDVLERALDEFLTRKGL